MKAASRGIADSGAGGKILDRKVRKAGGKKS
jgi:hypothetical protein